MNQLNELCLEITAKCPLECVHCSSNSSPLATEELDFELIKQILKDFKELGGKILQISGGEPLLHKEIHKIIEYAKQKNLKTYLYTSGLDRLLKLTPDRFLFGLHGSNSEINKRVTGKDNFSKIISIIKKLKNMNAYVGIHFVPLKINYQELEGLCQIASKLNINELAILRFVPHGRGHKNKDLLLLNKEEIKNLLSNIKKLKDKYKFLRLGCPIDFSSNTSKCKAGKSTLAIKPNGDVTPCPAFKNEKILGNIKKQNLKRIWKNFPVFKLEDLYKGKCLAQRYYHKGKDPWWEIAKEVYSNEK